MFHIAAASVALLSGTVALATRKGGRLHRRAGTVFVAAMLAMFATGIGYAFYKPDANILLTTSAVVGGYLVVTAFQSVRRRDGVAGRVEKSGLAVVLGCAGVYVWLSYMAANSPTGMFNEVGQMIILPNLFLALLAAALDVNFIARGRINGKQRIARHAWRISVGMFVVTSAFFLGGFGQKFFIPEALHGNPLLAIPPAAVLLFMGYWLIRLRFARAIGQGKRKLVAALKRLRRPVPAPIAAAIVPRREL